MTLATKEDMVEVWPSDEPAPLQPMTIEEAVEAGVLIPEERTLWGEWSININGRRFMCKKNGMVRRAPFTSEATK